MPTLRQPMRLEDCTVKTTADAISGKWKTLILYHLKDGPVRFGELQRLTADASHKVLAEQLRELETDGIVTRIEHPGKPLKVEYTLSEHGLTLKPILAMMADWGASLRARRDKQQLVATGNTADKMTYEQPENMADNAVDALQE